MTGAISNNGYNTVTINMGILNCIGEPYVVTVGKHSFVLRYNCTAKDGDYGKITLEAMAD